MRSKVAVIVSLLFVLGIGAAALAVNTRILDSSPQPDIGRANEVLAPGSAPSGETAVAPSTAPVVAPPAVPTASPPNVPAPRSDDHRSGDDHDESEEPDHDSDD
jgi:hypothetical protein